MWYLGVLLLPYFFDLHLNFTSSYCCCCCCCWYFPPVHRVCPNYEVVGFQLRTLTTPDLGSVAYFYVHFLTRPTLSSFLTMSRLPCCLLCPDSAQDHPTTRASPVSVPEYQDNYVPSHPSFFTNRFLLFRLSLTLATPSRFPSSPLPCCFRNIF